MENAGFKSDWLAVEVMHVTSHHLLLAHRGIQTIKPKDSRGQDRSGQGALQRRQSFDKQRGAHSKPPHLYCEHRGTVMVV